MIFLNYLQHSPTSTFGSGLSTSARYEYEKYVGTLCHIHLIIEVDYAKLNWDQTNFVDDFIHATISEIVRSEDVQKIVDGVFQNIDSFLTCKKILQSFFLIFVMKDVRFVHVQKNIDVESGTIDWKPKTILKIFCRNILMIYHNIVYIDYWRLVFVNH